jgi:hypothetical protein
MTDHVQIKEAIAAYVMHAIDPDDRARTEHELLEHLPGCESCSALMRDLRELSGDLGLASDPRAMSETGEARVMAAVTGSRPAATARARRAWPRAAAAVVAVAIAGSAAVNVVVASRSSRAEDHARSALAALSVVADPRAHRAALQGARGSLVMSVLPDGTGVLIAQGIGAPPRGSVYELWLAKDARYIPVRTFSPDGGNVVLHFKVDPGSYTSTAVTIERSYVTQPTRSPTYFASIPT